MSNEVVDRCGRIPRMKVLVIGAGIVGQVRAAGLALKNPDVDFVLADRDEERIIPLMSARTTFHEPGLTELLRQTVDENLHCTTDVEKHVSNSTIIFVCVGTPTKATGIGARSAPNLSAWDAVARMLAGKMGPDTIVVESSTVPVRAASVFTRIFHANQGQGAPQEVFSNPEFLAEGSAVRDFLEPDRVLIGLPHDPCVIRGLGERWLLSLYESWVPKEKILLFNVATAELGKLVANAALALRISFVNSFVRFCERPGIGVDVRDLARVVGTDKRVGPDFLRAGIGFGGSCFEKDIRCLIYLMEHEGCHEDAELLRQILVVNTRQRERFVRTVSEAFAGALAGKTIALFGWSFKPGTDDLRESPAVDVAHVLFEEGVNLRLHDPAMHARSLESGWTVVYNDGSVGHRTICKTPYEAADGADAVLHLTEWPEYRELLWKNIFLEMRRPAFIFDGRNCLDHEALWKIGFNVYGMGIRPRTHF